MLVLSWSGQSAWLRLISAITILTISLLRISAGISWPMDIIGALAAGVILGLILNLGFRGTERILLTEVIA